MNPRKPIEKLNGKLNVVGSNIQKYREKMGISRQKLSNLLIMLGIDIHYQSIYDIEMGSRTVTDYELCAFAKVLNVSTDDLLIEFHDYLNSI